MRWLLRALVTLLRFVVEVVDGVVRTVVERVTGRDFAGEAAQEAQAEATARDAAAREAEVEARHEELVATIEKLTKKEPEAEVEPVKTKSVAERRREIAAQSRSHDVTIRSSTWDPEVAIDDAGPKFRIA